MRSTAAALLFVGVFAAPVAAQAPRGSHIPPGHLPPAGSCRVWYEGRPPGHQPPPMKCRDAEWVARRDRSARVIYGGTHDGNGRRWNQQYPSWGLRDHYTSAPFGNGYADGYEKGLDDGRDNDRYDPIRHGRYRSADHGYKRRYGSKGAYKNIYRDGFRAGYKDGYRDAARHDSRRRGGGFGLPWPF